MIDFLEELPSSSSSRGEAHSSLSTSSQQEMVITVLRNAAADWFIRVSGGTCSLLLDGLKRAEILGLSPHCL